MISITVGTHLLHITIRHNIIFFYGPWMKRWDIVHHNRHTESLKTEGSSWHSHKPGQKA